MRIVDFVVCDDIRQEQGGKISLMGIYNDSIGLVLSPETTWPILFRMGIYIRLDLEGKWEDGCTFSLEAELEGASLMKFEGSLDKRPESKVITLPLTVPFLQFAKPGTLHFQFKLMNNKSEVLCFTDPSFQLAVAKVDAKGSH